MLNDPIDRELDRHRNTTMAPHGVGLPDFEAMVVLNAAIEDPGLQKSRLVARVLDTLGLQEDRERVFLRYVDTLVSLGHLTRNNFRFYVTQTGRDFYRSTLTRNRVALRALAYGTL